MTKNIILSVQVGLDVRTVITKIKKDGMNEIETFGSLYEFDEFLLLHRKQFLYLYHPMHIIDHNEKGISLSLFAPYSDDTVVIQTEDVKSFCIPSDELSKYYDREVRKHELMLVNPETRQMLKELIRNMEAGNISFTDAQKVAHSIVDATGEDVTTTVTAEDSNETKH